jgi:alpha-ketoglutarate-dependent 2,4-dichlorophenoxyacetate dioxygenase
MKRKSDQAPNIASSKPI